MRNCSAPRETGFSYIGLLIAVALIGVALSGAAQLASTDLQREREVQLLFVGDQYADAIESYRAASPGGEQYPQQLEQLLKDARFPNVRRHLRRLYPDPMTNRADWVLVRAADGGIRGVHSRSPRVPLKKTGFDTQYAHFAQAASYEEWTFAPQAGVAPAGNEGGGATSAAPPPDAAL